MSAISFNVRNERPEYKETIVAEFETDALAASYQFWSLEATTNTFIVHNSKVFQRWCVGLQFAMLIVWGSLVVGLYFHGYLDPFFPLVDSSDDTPEANLDPPEANLDPPEDNLDPHEDNLSQEPQENSSDQPEANLSEEPEENSSEEPEANSSEEPEDLSDQPEENSKRPIKFSQVKLPESMDLSESPGELSDSPGEKKKVTDVKFVLEEEKKESTKGFLARAVKFLTFWRR